VVFAMRDLHLALEPAMNWLSRRPANRNMAGVKSRISV
jgi:hypothetical protein